MTSNRPVQPSRSRRESIRTVLSGRRRALPGRISRLGRIIAACVAALAGLAFVPSCAEMDGSASAVESNKNAQSVGRGYRDGFDDGLAAWSDMHANWMWLWTMPEDYPKEYNRGWADGRNLRKMKEQQRQRQF